MSRLLDLEVGQEVEVTMPTADGRRVMKTYRVELVPFGSSRSLRQGYDPDGYLDEEVSLRLKEVEVK